MAAPGIGALGRFLFFSKYSVKNILQGNVQVVEQTAFELRYQRGTFLFAHLGDLPVGMKRVNVVKDKGGFSCAVYLY